VERSVRTIGEGGFDGMQTFDQGLFEVVNDGRVDMATAISYATRPQDFKLLVAGGGVLGTSIDQVEQLAAAGTSALAVFWLASGSARVDPRALRASER
jgi:hypothetical protein